MHNETWIAAPNIHLPIFSVEVVEDGVISALAMDAEGRKLTPPNSLLPCVRLSSVCRKLILLLFPEASM